MTYLKTAIYEVGYITPDHPLSDIGAASQQMATAVEAALVRGGIAPPAAQDLATLAGRVSTLESGYRVAPLTRRAPVSFSNNWGHLAPTVWESLQVGMSPMGLVTVTGAITKTGAALAAGVTEDAFTLPAGLAPRRTALRGVQVGGAAQPRARCEVASTGVVKLVGPTGGIPAGEYVAFDIHFWSASVQTTDT